MPFSHLQGATSAVGTTPSVTVTLGAAPTPGNLVCVGCAYGGSSGAGTFVPPIQVKDGAGNLYVITPSSPAQGQPSTLAPFIFLGYLLPVPVGASASITLTFTGDSGNLCLIRAEEFSFAGFPAQFDADAVGSGTTGTTVNSPSITPSGAGELLYSTAAVDHSITSANSPWTQDAAGVDGNGGDGEYILSSASGATTVNYTVAVAGEWNAMAMAFSQVPPIYMLALG